ncbi:hypothetical protein F4819DRAFT_459953 [Hypoxylon fuscum]|nr:hypothetical protein F4819DRAFT_459953 [Hypoxylon fuscum]
MSPDEDELARLRALPFLFLLFGLLLLLIHHHLTRRYELVATQYSLVVLTHVICLAYVGTCSWQPDQRVNARQPRSTNYKCRLFPCRVYNTL